MTSFGRLLIEACINKLTLLTSSLPPRRTRTYCLVGRSSSPSHFIYAGLNAATFIGTLLLPSAGRAVAESQVAHLPLMMSCVDKAAAGRPDQAAVSLQIFRSYQLERGVARLFERQGENEFRLVSTWPVTIRSAVERDALEYRVWGIGFWFEATYPLQLDDPWNEPRESFAAIVGDANFVYQLYCF